MQKYILLTILGSFFFMGSVFAEVIPPKSNTTDKDSRFYYDNDAQTNQALSPEARAYSLANPLKFAEITGLNKGECGINCAKMLDAAAKNTSVSAGSANPGGSPTAVPTSDSNTVIVTEKVPGADCQCDIGDGSETACDNNLVGRKYKCTITAGGGLVGFQKIMAEITRVFVYITLLFGVLAIVGLGIGYAIFSGGDEEKTKLIKNYAVNLMIGMMLLFFFRYILVFLAPWIFQ